jgi:hypothetical protein
MIRLMVIIVSISFFVSSATAFPLGIGRTGPANEEPVQVRLTKSNACKPKYKHKKAAQDLREKAHCK